MYIYLSDSIIFSSVFVCGLIVGAAIYRLLARLQDALDKARIEVMEELILTFEKKQQPTPPKSRMPPLKAPKKSAGVSDWNGSIPQSRSAPPKPLHNPHL